jgi:hypothetical protein
VAALGLHHIQRRENHVQEKIASNFVIIYHIDGKVNLADIFTKEMKIPHICQNYVFTFCI